ncbi:MAG: ATP synthase A1 subunit C [Actinobacteria bacterium HGW-Actinobacteria-1]|nr:MAG: ATP synthase A1 subunit C [Actinobacteria bacterium HGW-Actinobacteria-1]
MSSTTTMKRVSPSKRDYGYCNARVRGMRSRLLKQAFMDGLMQAKDLGGIITSLMETEYAPELEERLLHGRSTGQIDLALKDNMVRTFRKVLSLVNDESLEVLGALLGRWDLFNIKTVIRGRHMSLSSEEITESMVAVAQLSQIDLDELSRQQSVKGVVDTLSTWKLPFAVPLRAAMPEYVESGNLAVLELALDKYYTEWAAKRLKGRGVNQRLSRRFLGTQIDTINLLTCFRLLNADLGDQDALRFFLPGGTFVTEALFRDLASMSDVDEVYDRLKRTPYGRPVEEVAVKYIESGSVSVFERALEDYLMRRAFAAGQGDPLGVGIIIAYLWMKANEVTNLRIIVKGVSVGMPTERMREELIVV